MSILDDLMGEYGFAVPKAAYDKLQEHVAAQQTVNLSDDVIRDVFMRNGFTIKDGQDDLKPYVYSAAQAVDLGQFRDAVAGAEDFIARHSWTWNGVGAHPNGVRTGLVRLLALIDGSKAVSNG